MIKKAPLYSLLLILGLFQINCYGQEKITESYISVVESYPELCNAIGHSYYQGLLVLDIAVGSGAYRDGVRKGSIITMVECKSKKITVNLPKIQEFIKFTNELKPGDIVDIKGHYFIKNKAPDDLHISYDSGFDFKEKASYVLQESFLTKDKCIVNEQSGFIHRLNMKHTPIKGSTIETVFKAQGKSFKLCSVCYNEYACDQKMLDIEIALNAKAVKEIQMPILREPVSLSDKDKEMMERVKRVGFDLVKQSKRPYLQFCFLIADIEEPNAYSLPGGIVIITKGLMEMIENDSELAVVLGHEITHINSFHTIFNIKSEQNWQALGAFFGVIAAVTTTVAVASTSKGDSNDVNKIKAGVLGGMGLYQIVSHLKLNGYKKKQELEADKGGFELAEKVSYFNKDEGIQIFKKMWDIELAEDKPFFLSFKKTHPEWKKRLEALGFEDK